MMNVLRGFASLCTGQQGLQEDKEFLLSSKSVLFSTSINPSTEIGAAEWMLKDDKWDLLR